MKAACRLFLIFSLLSGAVLADYDHGMRYVFVASANNKSVAIIDLHDLRLAETVRLQYAPGDLAASDRLDTLVLAYPAARRLGFLDLASSGLEQEYTDLTMTPDIIRLDPAGSRLVVYDRARAVLEILDVQRRRSLVQMENVHTSLPLTFSRDGRVIYWVDTGSGRFNSGDLQGNTASVSLTDSGAGLSAMTRSVDGSMGFISDARAGHVYVINLRSMELIKTIAIGGEPGRAWGTADGRSLLIPGRRSGRLTVLSTFTLETVASLEAGVDPVTAYSGWLDSTAVVVNPAGAAVLINLENGGPMKSFMLHGGPRAGVVSSDSRLLVLPVAGNGDLYIFDMKSLSVAKRITGLPADLGDASLAVSNNLCH